MTTTAGAGWNEDKLSERPAVALLQKLGYLYLPAAALDAGRGGSLREVVLADRLGAALRKLNPWLSDANVHKAIRAIIGAQAASLIELSKLLHGHLTAGISLEQDLGKGTQGQTVRFFDFEQPRNNDFVVTRQLRVKGAQREVIPDIVLYVNGLPLVVIECKSPTIGEKWKTDAIHTQLLRYQELDEAYRNLGAPQLFGTVQLLVATCDQEAFYGTVGTPQRYYAAWKEPYPYSREEIARVAGREPTPQDVLIHGMLHPDNLLDIVRNFVVFEQDQDTQRLVRKVCRYQQFRAVNRALARAREAKKVTGRGGVVWHTQGSGKSLTMLWLALKLRRDKEHENPTIVLVTDRVDLDAQISGTFQRCGYTNPERAESVKDLRRLLTGGGGRTVLTTVHKFQEVTGTPTVRGNKGLRTPRVGQAVLSAERNVFVLADEAHRTQYGGMAATMRNALPNAAFFGFTGTPIDKEDRSTLQTFGDYIDTYPIQQAVADGATVPILYEARLPELRMIGQSLDALFNRVFKDRSLEEREAIKKKYGTEESIARAPRRVEAICADLIEHYETKIQPNGFKAQIVTTSREAAVTYAETLKRLQGPRAVVIMSSTNKDEQALADHHTSEAERQDCIQRFLNRKDPLAILIVCDMLLTGFDAPVEQVMYLDAPLKEHTLLQAIARVNRLAEGKTHGLVVDYWGVSQALEEALKVFAPQDVAGSMTPLADELPRLQARHATVLRFFAGVKDQSDLQAYLKVLDDAAVRAEFNLEFRRFSQSVDMLLPDPRALPFLADLRWLGKVRQAARVRFRDATLDISDCGAKVRKLIDDAIAVDGVKILMEPVALFSKEFDARLAALQSDEARASEMEHALNDEIHVKLEEDPVFYSSLKERLEKIIEDRKAKRIDDAKQLALMVQVREDMEGRGGAEEALGLSAAGVAVYGLLEEVRPLQVAEKRDRRYNEANKALAEVLLLTLEPQMQIVDWTEKEDVQREMRRLMKRQLQAAKLEAERIEPLVLKVMELMRVRKGR
ncbi:type I restriction endonuclease subunit R [Chondromyces apiculatus]|uniref:Type I restriction enzyme endonuclease subunit n=1 Tax=Chondromyces apiculatus DSM 436 TaxID=1192034 RepID=A0A017T1F6_9BACT|nr:type I restriction endonuclease subunit R [Chondromyces apiculatus]EYF02680.1 Type I restriction-modification system, restriction subunit R [Chondromyces apiculatus DSM 436]